MNTSDLVAESQWPMDFYTSKGIYIKALLSSDKRVVLWFGKLVVDQIINRIYIHDPNNLPNPNSILLCVSSCRGVLTEEKKYE